MEAYCVKCRSQQEMSNSQAVTMKNGRPATQGVCPVCSTKMFRIGKDCIVRCFPENPTPKAVGRGAAAMSDGLGRRPNRRQVGVGRYGHSNSHIDQERGRKSRTST